MSPRYSPRYYVITLYTRKGARKLPALTAKREAIRVARREVAKAGVASNANVHLVTEHGAPTLLYQCRATEQHGSRVHVQGLEL